MNKLSQILVLLILFSSTSVFCKNSISETNVSDSLSNGKKNNGIFEIGIGVKEAEIEKAKVNFIKCFPINSNLSWGIGTGLHIYSPNYLSIPLYANFKANLFSYKTTPYFSVNAGYYVYSKHDYPGFLLNPTIGVSFIKSKSRSFDIGIGYDMKFINGLDYSNFHDLVIDIRDDGLLSINLGISF